LLAALVSTVKILTSGVSWSREDVQAVARLPLGCLVAGLSRVLVSPGTSL